METRSALVDAARALAERRPLAEVSNVEIAARAGVSPQTVGRYFPDRASLAAELGVAAGEPLDTRARILAAAEVSFARLGYHGASLDAVAAAAGMTKGAVYSNFAGKSALFLALLDLKSRSRFAELEASLDAVIAAGARDPRATAERLFAAALDFSRTEPHLPRLYLEFVSQTREPAVQKRLRKHYLDGMAQLARIVGRLQQAGLLSGRLPAAALARLIGVSFDGLIVGGLVGGLPADPDSLARELVALFGP